MSRRRDWCKWHVLNTCCRAQQSPGSGCGADDHWSSSLHAVPGTRTAPVQCTFDHEYEFNNDVMTKKDWTKKNLIAELASIVRMQYRVAKTCWPCWPVSAIFSGRFFWGKNWSVLIFTPFATMKRLCKEKEGFALFNKQENLGIEEKRYKQHCHVLDPVEAVLCERDVH